MKKLHHSNKNTLFSIFLYARDLATEEDAGGGCISGSCVISFLISREPLFSFFPIKPLEEKTPSGVCTVKNASGSGVL